MAMAMEPKPWPALAICVAEPASFGVATLQEGIESASSGARSARSWCLATSQPDDLRACLHWQLMPTLSSMREALLCQNLASGSGRPLRCPAQDWTPA